MNIKQLLRRIIHPSTGKLAYVKDGKTKAIGTVVRSQGDKVYFKPHMGFGYWIEKRYLRAV